MNIGLERLTTDQSHLLRGQRFALLMNRASVDRHVRLACDLLAESHPRQLKAILTPQHGLWCEQQANMIETPHGWHDRLQVPVYSLYCATRRPDERTLAGIDCLVIDLQDVGTRVYTFIWTMLYCLQECAARGITAVVADRPNPLGGEISEGPLLDLNFRSFVGEAAIPMRHGLTIGELAKLFNESYTIGAELHVVPMQNWNPGRDFDHTGRLWIPPSPNMPTVQTAFVYPGQVMLEGTSLSEGRGTTVPFEVVGAPFINPDVLCDSMQNLALPGVSFLPIRFIPAFDKWRGESCGGVSIHVTDRTAFRSFEMTVRLLQKVHELYGTEFCFNSPPYEYETSKMPIDIISGGSFVREAVQDPQLTEAAIAVPDAWARQTADCLIYPRSPR